MLVDEASPLLSSPGTVTLWWWRGLCVPVNLRAEGVVWSLVLLVGSPMAVVSGEGPEDPMIN